MSETQKLDLVSGEIVLLTSTETERQRLIDVCDRQQIKFNWREMTQQYALKLALKRTYRGHLVRKARRGMVVVEEQVGADGNKYESTSQFTISDWNVESPDLPIDENLKVQARVD